MESYLQNDCYCTGEIYDVTGFFYNVFNKEEDCVQIGEKVKENENYIICVSCRDQILNFWIGNDTIISAERYDATENNIKLIKLFLANKDIGELKIDEFNEGETKKNLDDIMQFADAIMIN